MAPPPDIEIRPIDVADPSQVEAAFAIASQCEIDAVGSTDSTRESVHASLTAPGAWPDEHRLAVAAGVPVGLLVCERDRLGREVYLDAYAVGADASDVQRSLLMSGVAAAGRLAAREPAPSGGDVGDPYALSPDRWQVVAAGFANDVAYAEVLASLGFRPIRRFWRMILDLTTAPAVVPTPAGASIRAVDGDADRRLLHALFRESFAEHFGSSHDHPFDDWIAGLEALPGSDPNRWWIVELDDRAVGLCILDDSRVAFGEGYLRTLGVVPGARGRGLGRWLIAEAAADARARGRTGLALAVDGENTTGATALYESAGFTIRQAVDVWCYPLAD